MKVKDYKVIGFSLIVVSEVRLCSEPAQVSLLPLNVPSCVTILGDREGSELSHRNCSFHTGAVQSTLDAAP